MINPNGANEASCGTMRDMGVLKATLFSLLVTERPIPREMADRYAALLGVKRQIAEQIGIGGQKPALCVSDQRMQDGGTNQSS